MTTDAPGYEIAESAIAPGTWTWALWAPAGGFARARNCVAARQGFASPTEALKDLNRFKAAAASAVIVKQTKQSRRKAS